jgi:hypothetical protein
VMSPKQQEVKVARTTYSMISQLSQVGKHTSGKRGSVLKIEQQEVKVARVLVSMI